MGGFFRINIRVILIGNDQFGPCDVNGVSEGKVATSNRSRVRNGSIRPLVRGDQPVDRAPDANCQF